MGSLPAALRVLAGSAGLIVGLSLAAPVRAQSIGAAPGRDLPSWLTRWSVLSPRADLPRRFPTASSAIPVSLLARTPIGLFWTAGNPAGLAGDIDSARTDFMGAAGRTGGDFRRPLDPGGATLKQISATSWGPITPRVTMLGRVVLDQERWDPGAQSDETEAYPTSPFVTTDTTTSPTRRTRARLEGVAGWRLGEWAIGADLGYDSRENQTIEAGFVRRARQTMPGLAIGITRRLGGVVVGVLARYRNRIETLQLTERASNGQVVQLEGYRDVIPISVQQFYYRRIEENVPSLSVGLSGTIGGARWVAFGELARLRERRARQQVDDPAADRWNAKSWTAGAALQRGLGGRGRWLLTVDARYTSLTGDGDLALDSAGTVFVATERAFDGRAELRLLADDTPWTGLVALTSRIEQRVRNDSVAVVGTDIKTLDLGLSLELGRAISSAVTLIGTVALQSRTSNSRIPNADRRGPVYQRVFAPEVSFYARDLATWSAGAAIRWQAAARTGFWIAARTASVAPRGGLDPTGYAPDGSRTSTSMVLGVTLR